MKLRKCYPLNISNWKIHISHSRRGSVWSFSETYDLIRLALLLITPRGPALIPCRCGASGRWFLFMHRSNPLALGTSALPVPCPPGCDRHTPWWLALPHPSRLTIYTFRKENTFINTMLVAGLTSKGVSSLRKCSILPSSVLWSLKIKDSWINSLSTDVAFLGYHFLLSGKWALQLKLLKPTPWPWSRKQTFISFHPVSSLRWKAFSIFIWLLADCSWVLLET